MSIFIIHEIIIIIIIIIIIFVMSENHKYIPKYPTKN